MGLAVLNRAMQEATKPLPAGANNERPDPAFRIGAPSRVLWRKPLVIMIVPREVHVHVSVVEHLKEISYHLVISMLPGTESRRVRKSQRAFFRVSREVGAQPVRLR